MTVPDIPEGAVQAAFEYQQGLPPTGMVVSGGIKAALSRLASTPEGQAYLLGLVFSGEEQAAAATALERALHDDQPGPFHSAYAKLEVALGEKR